MAEAKSQAEPTMEEILASIRRIISEDEPEAAALEAEQSRAEPEPEPVAAAEKAAAEDNVLDLTQKLNEDGTVVDLADRTAGAKRAMPSEPEPEPEPELETMAEPEAEPETMAEAEPEPEPFEEEPVEAPAEEPESLLAPAVQAATTGALAEITKAVASGRRASVHVGDGRTLEDIVREALTPELKAWLDANLAPLVEQVVRDEVKKMVRRAEEL